MEQNDDDQMQVALRKIHTISAEDVSLGILSSINQALNEASCPLKKILDTGVDWIPWQQKHLA